MAVAASELANTLQPPRRWRFGRVRFDEAGFELHVDGQPIEVERKPLEVLKVLLDHAGKVVTKSQLVQLAWPGRVIGDAALAKAIARLREAIGDTEHDIVRTHHRYGYRLVADVAVEDAGASVPMAAPTVPTPASPATPRSDAEHRVLTMMFCDIVDSTRLAESLDPEAFRDLLVEYQRSTAEIAKRYEGHVAQQFGDGMLFYFGYPDAHDDDAERALRCACELLRFADRAGPYTRLAMRIGVHTGPVVIGQAKPGSEALATGPHLHVASRLQGLAEPDTILVSDATFRLIPGLFVTRDFGLQSLRGMTEPMRVHQVLQPSGARSRLETQRRLTPFAGRDAELALVDTRWDEAIEGHGGAILFRGEPGIGKSRLLLELRAHLAGSAHTWLEGRADALNRHSAFHVVAEVLQRGFAIDPAADDAQRLQALERRLADLELAPESAIPLLAPLLGLPETERYPASSLTPEARRAKTLDLLVAWSAALADEQPLVLVIEDLHWCDESSLEFIGGLIARLDALPLLLVMTARPEFVPAWPSTDALRIVPLEGLPRPAVEKMLSDLAVGEALAPALAQRIVERAAGVPLFVEELTRSLLESGRDAAVPESLNAVLRARLDRLGPPARELIQTAAVIGLECPHGLLRQVSGLDETDLDPRVCRLTDAGLLLVQGSANERLYTFKHALIRDSAYATLLKSTRQRLHERAAHALETLHAARLDDHASALAHHCEQAGQFQRAATFAQRAGELAMRASANREASTLFATAIRLLESGPASDERTNVLLQLYMNRVNLLASLNGYLDPEVETAHARAAELARVAARDAALIPVLYWIGALDAVRGKYGSSIEAFTQLDTLARTLDESKARMAAGAVTGQALFVLGRYEEAERCERNTLGLYVPADCRDVALLYGEDSFSTGAATLSWPVWARGFPDQARLLRERSLAHARELGYDANLGTALSINAFGAQMAGDSDEVARIAREGLELCRNGGFPWFEAFCAICLAWHTARRDPDRAVSNIRQAIEVFTGGGARFVSSWAFTTEAQVQAAAGDVDGALQSIAMAFQHAETTGEAFYLAETLGLRGELMWRARGDVAGAEDDFRRALQVARDQGGRSWELRAAMRLARLLQAQCRSTEARAELAPVFAAFTEGFDTPDLRAAKALLDQLA